MTSVWFDASEPFRLLYCSGNNSYSTHNYTWVCLKRFGSTEPHMIGDPGQVREARASSSPHSHLPGEFGSARLWLALA